MSNVSKRKVRVIPYTGAMGSVLRTVDVNDDTGRVTNDITQRVDNRSAFDGYSGSQVTDSVSHPSWRRRKSGVFQGDLGGPFTSVKKYCVLTEGSSHADLVGRAWINPNHSHSDVTYSGPIMPAPPTQMVVFPPTSASSESTLAQLGTVAIARCSPSNPTTDLAVALKEFISEGFPHLIGETLAMFRGLTNAAIHKDLADEYLNLEFGWKPFVADLKELMGSVLHADRIIGQYERDSGKLVRRGYDFPPTESRTDQVWRTGVGPWTNPSSGALQDPLTKGKGQVILTTKVAKRQWFRGAFSYYVPPAGESLRSDMARFVIEARKLYGLSLTPDVIWNSAPWSWVFDWFSNTSETIRNWSSWAIDNQVVAYGYMMEHSLKSYTYTYVGPTGFQTSGVRPPVVEFVTETKLRRQATPYGFGINWSGLTPRQLAIAAALGITRG